MGLRPRPDLDRLRRRHTGFRRQRTRLDRRQRPQRPRVRPRPQHPRHPLGRRRLSGKPAPDRRRNIFTAGAIHAAPAVLAGETTAAKAAALQIGTRDPILAATAGTAAMQLQQHPEYYERPLDFAEGFAISTSPTLPGKIEDGVRSAIVGHVVAGNISVSPQRRGWLRCEPGSTAES